MFVYYFVVLARGPFERVERVLEELLKGDGLDGAARVAYRKGEELHSRLGLGGGPVAKGVRLGVGPAMSRSEGPTGRRSDPWGECWTGPSFMESRRRA